MNSSEGARSVGGLPSRWPLAMAGRCGGNKRRWTWQLNTLPCVDCVWNVMAHAQKPDFVFRRNGRVHLNRQWRLAAEVCASTVVMLDTPRSEVVWRIMATHSIRHLPLHFPSLRHRVPSRFNWTLQTVAICAATGLSAGGGLELRVWLLEMTVWWRLQVYR